MIFYVLFLGMIVIDKTETVAAGTTTNGANHKIPGYRQRLNISKDLKLSQFFVPCVITHAR